MKPSTALLGLSVFWGAAVQADAGTLQVAPVTAKPILAKVESRAFLYNRGLSSPGTLAVDRVRYQVEVLDPRDETNLLPGSRILVDVPGSCPRLMQAENRYQIDLAITPQGWIAGCGEQDAVAVVARHGTGR